MSTRRLCADAARARGDKLVGSAGPATTWVLVEHRAAWPKAAADAPLFADGAGRQLLMAANRTGTRLLLVRRPGKRAHDDSPAALAVVSQRLRRSWWREQSGDDDLLAAAELLGRHARRGPDKAPADLDDPARDGWQESTEELLLVCAHAQHDPCCAVRGRSAAAALAAEHGQVTWECSHLGGDRFAGNLLVLPEGVLYGGLDGPSAVECVASHRAGLVRVESLRGICGLPPYVNTALAQVWTLYPDLSRHRPKVLETTTLEPGAWLVDVEVPSAVLTVQVRSVSEPAVLLTCHAGRPAAPTRLDSGLTTVTSLRSGGKP